MDNKYKYTYEKTADDCYNDTDVLINKLNVANDKVDSSYSEVKIIISKATKEKISLEERFLNYNGENLAKEFSWDVPQGKELW